MIQEYLENTNPNMISYYGFCKWSKLSFPEASSEWMQNLETINQYKNETIQRKTKR